MSVSYLFQTFLNNLAVKNRSEISKRYNEITKVLNQNFRNSSSETDNCFQIGSFGRNTAIDGISDLDMLYILPDDIKKDLRRKLGTAFINGYHRARVRNKNGAYFYIYRN